MTKHYVNFLYPGLFISNDSTQEIPAREISKIPKGCYGYQIYDVEEVESGGEVLRGKPKNHTPWHYLGKKLSKEDVAQKYGRHSVLYQNMDCNRWDYIVDTIFGQSFPLNDGDIVEASP